MRAVIKDIMKVIPNITESEAENIEETMATEIGTDFSECTMSEFTKDAREATKLIFNNM